MLSEWGRIGNLKQLPEFLGTANYSPGSDRTQVCGRDGPAPEAFPMTPRGLEAVERLNLKRLMRKATCWFPSNAPLRMDLVRTSSRPDCCKAGLGGAHLQMSADLRRWNLLAYHAESVSPVRIRSDRSSMRSSSVGASFGPFLDRCPS